MPHPLVHGANYEWYKVKLNILEFTPGNFSKKLNEKKLIDPARIWTMESPDS